MYMWRTTQKKLLTKTLTIYALSFSNFFAYCTEHFPFQGPINCFMLHWHCKLLFLLSNIMSPAVTTPSICTPVYIVHLVFSSLWQTDFKMFYQKTSQFCLLISSSQLIKPHIAYLWISCILICKVSCTTFLLSMVCQDTSLAAFPFAQTDGK